MSVGEGRRSTHHPGDDTENRVAALPRPARDRYAPVGYRPSACRKSNTLIRRYATRMLDSLCAHARELLALTQIRREFTFTAGQVMVRGKLPVRVRRRRADWIPGAPQITLVLPH